MMRAVDVMVRHPVTVHPNTTIAHAVELLRKHDVSALPVIDQRHNLVGILSEADLLQRIEIGTERHRPWWLEAVTGAPSLAQEFAKSHGKTVGEIMTTDVVSGSEGTSLSEIARLLERNRIKRIPITRDGKLVGVVSRSNLIQALASTYEHGETHSDDDAKIRSELLARLEQQSWTDFGDRNITVSRGTVHLWGLVSSDEERRALIALAETVPGVARVSDEMFRTY
jgi:CBS domain-containing protein